MLELLARANSHSNRIAIRDTGGLHTYRDLLLKSKEIATHLVALNGIRNESRIAFLLPASFAYVSVQWGIWRAGCVAVPLCMKHPSPTQTYVLEDAEVSCLIMITEGDPELAQWCRDRGIAVLFYNALPLLPVVKPLPSVDKDQRAMILYTSGTTGKPKGVVTTHQTIESQISTLVKAWQWQKSDHILNVLPLHHVHGIVNVLSCALWSGACCEFLEKFTPPAVWQVFRLGFVNVFMAVPTIYHKLINYWEGENQIERDKLSASLKHFRLMVSGSAALPISVLQKWREISGQILLERYGMTEIGMALSNPYTGERRPGHVGIPLPGMEVRLVDANNVEIQPGQVGEIQVYGRAVFKEYWQRPDETEQAFTSDGWFKTGDMAKVNQGYYQILGRNSVDIIKSGGYKISALQIEELAREHEAVQDCAVVGIPDDEWGEVVAIAYTLNTTSVSSDALRTWLRSRLPAYQVPRAYLQVASLPRNTIGKVTKPAVKTLIKAKCLREKS